MIKINKSNLIAMVTFFLFALIEFSNTAFGADEFSRYSILGNLSGNANLYSAHFKELPGISNCCTEFNNGNGIGYGFNLGMGYDLKKKFLFSKVRLDAVLDFNDLSGRFSEKAFFGNIIIGNEYVRGISEHRIDAALNILSLEEGISFLPFEDLPFSLRFGFKSGIFINNTYHQKELLVDPPKVNFETGSRGRNETSGNIPEISKAMFALTALIKYDAYTTGNFVFSPEIKFEYGLNYVVAPILWKVNNVKFGIDVAYKIPKTKIEPPKPAPEAPLPQAPKGNMLNLALNLKYKGKPIRNSDTIMFNITQKSFVRTYPILPVIYFSENSDKPSIKSASKIENFSDAQSFGETGIISYLKNNSEINAKVTVCSLQNEDENVGSKRKEYIIGLLNKNGIKSDRVRFEEVITGVNIISESKIKHRELEDEHRFAQFNFSSDSKLVYFNSDSARQVNAEDVDIEIHARTDSKSQPITVSGAIYHRNSKIFNFSNEPVIYSIKDNNANSVFNQSGNNLTIIALATDAEGNSKDDTISIFLKPMIKNDRIVENLIETEQDSLYTQQFIVGFFDFDKADVKYINFSALNVIKSAVSHGSAIEIIPMTDNFGTEAHNKNLELKRAKAAADLLNLKSGDYKLVFPEDYFYSNNSLQGRIFNRSVMVNIRSTK